MWMCKKRFAAETAITADQAAIRRLDDAASARIGRSRSATGDLSDRACAREERADGERDACHAACPAAKYRRGDRETQTLATSRAHRQPEAIGVLGRAPARIRGM